MTPRSWPKKREARMCHLLTRSKDVSLTETEQVWKIKSLVLDVLNMRCLWEVPVGKSGEIRAGNKTLRTAEKEQGV